MLQQMQEMLVITLLLSCSSCLFWHQDVDRCSVGLPEKPSLNHPGLFAVRYLHMYLLVSTDAILRTGMHHLASGLNRPV